MSKHNEKQVRRVVLKLSGEALSGQSQSPLCDENLQHIIAELAVAVKEGVQIGLVLGGGNFLRGASHSSSLIDRATADQMGMLATIINAIAFRDALVVSGLSARVFSAVDVPGMAMRYDIQLANASLADGRINIYAGGTGNPFCTTDSAASLRAVETHSDLMIKATKVDGVYDCDPKSNPNAKRFSHLSFDQALELQLGVMDLAAFCQCREFNLPIQVIDLAKPGCISAALIGSDEGTLIS